jgi:hypothetical protein
MQLAPIREFIAAITRFSASGEQVPSDNVGAGVFARAGGRNLYLCTDESA